MEYRNAKKEAFPVLLKGWTLALYKSGEEWRGHGDPHTLPAGDGHFLRIVSQMMEEVGNLTKTMARGQRGEVPAEGDEQSLMHGRKRHK